MQFSQAVEFDGDYRESVSLRANHTFAFPKWREQPQTPTAHYVDISALSWNAFLSFRNQMFISGIKAAKPFGRTPFILGLKAMLRVTSCFAFQNGIQSAFQSLNRIGTL